MSATSSVKLTDLELDALSELVNLGVSNAATSLREMIGEEVILSVPEVCVVTREVAIANLGERDGKSLVAVHQDFEGEIRGRAAPAGFGRRAVEQAHHAFDHEKVGIPGRLHRQRVEQCRRHGPGIEINAGRAGRCARRL